MKIEETVRQFVVREKLLTDDVKHIVALSGGADSVALMLILKRLGYQLEAAHCNFRLRGDESDRDEQFVISLCQKENIPLHLIHFDTALYAQLHKVSIEMAARELRYRYFEQLRSDVGAAEVCVAHHQDDAVETLLMNLVRGTGIHGLTGIRPRNGHIVRPLLCVSRSEIEQYLQELGQSYVTDSTNLVPDVVRNKLRLEVLPLLRQINPAAPANIARTARRMADVERVFDISIQQAVSCLSADGIVDVSWLLEQPAPEYLLYELLTSKGFTPQQVEQVYDHLHAQTGRLFQSPTHELAFDRGRLVIEQRREQPTPLTIPEPGVYCRAEQKYHIKLTDIVEISKSPDVATLDADKVRFPLTIRCVQSGDRFQPFGMKGSRLVSDYLTDCKRTVFEKRRQQVVCDAEGRIIWLIGERTDQRFAVDTSTCRLLRIWVDAE